MSVNEKTSSFVRYSDAKITLLVLYMLVMKSAKTVRLKRGKLEVDGRGPNV